MNIRFEYLYRDAGNFKNWGSVVFSNPNSISAKKAASLAATVLIDQIYFVANKVGVPDLHFHDHNSELDHGWHEVFAFQSTEELVNDPQKRSVEEFIEALATPKK